MPQFLSQRYNEKVAIIMAVFWLVLYIVVNLMSILYLGALAISGISGIDLRICIFALAIFAIIITLGGMKVIGFTDVVQVFFLVLGGLVATYIALNLISGGKGIGEGEGRLGGKDQVRRRIDQYRALEAGESRGQILVNECGVEAFEIEAEREAGDLEGAAGQLRRRLAVGLGEELDLQGKQVAEDAG